MQKALGKASEAVTTAMESNKKTTDMKPELREPSSSDRLTSDYGVKNTTHDIWLSASTGDRKGPALQEDNFGREKVRLRIDFPSPIFSLANKAVLRS
jgi:catalase